MTVIRHIETVLAALTFTIGLGWPAVDIALHAIR